MAGGRKRGRAGANEPHPPGHDDDQQKNQPPAIGDDLEHMDEWAHAEDQPAHQGHRESQRSGRGT